MRAATSQTASVMARLVSFPPVTALTTWRTRPAPAPFPATRRNPSASLWLVTSTRSATRRIAISSGPKSWVSSWLVAVHPRCFSSVV